MKARFFMALFMVVSLLVATWPQAATAQDGGDSTIVEALLTQLRGSYSNTAGQTNYGVAVQETTTQTTSIRRFQANTYLMDVAVYESYVNTQTFETAVEAIVIEEGLSATFDMGITQVQGLGYEYVRNGVVLSSPEDTEDQLELTLQVVQTGGNLYINSDETDPEFRAGVPDGWRRVVADTTPILSNASVSGEQIDSVIDGLRFSANDATMQNLLQVGVVDNIDVLGDGDINGQPVRRYRITFDGEAALTVLGLDYQQVIAELSAAASQAVPEATPEVTIAYVIEVAVGPDTNLVYEQIITLTVEGLFTGSVDSAAYALSQTNTKSYSGFGETELPLSLEEIIGG